MVKPIFDKKNILVVGGAGFIGSNLCAELVKTSKVICLDNLLTSSERNIDLLLQDPNFEFVKHDIAEPISLVNKEEGLEKFKVAWQGVQEIYYLASPTAHGDVAQYPTETLRANSVGVVNMLELARQNEAKFLFVSSAAVYGEPTDATKPVHESVQGIVDHIGDKSLYAEGKIFGETLTMAYHRAYNVDTKIVRLFNTYGPKLRLTDSRLIVEMIRQALNNEPINIYGGEQAMISYCYVDDAVKGLIRMMEQGDIEPVNLGHDAALPLVDLAKTIISLTDSTSTLNIMPDFSEQYHRPLLPDISKAKEKLSWFPITLLEDGLKKTIDYLRASQGLIELGKN